MVNLGEISSDHIFCIGFLFYFLSDTRPVFLFFLAHFINIKP